MSKEKANLEITLKNILYFIDDEKEQEKVIEILKKYEERFPDSRIKNFFQRHILNSKNDYYSKVDYLVKDILECKIDNNVRVILNEMINEIKPTVEKAEKTFWERLISIIRGS